MRTRSSILWLAASTVFVCLVFAATASSQSLVELAQKEKARRAEIATTGKTAADVIDADALSRVDGPFSAIGITGAEVEESSPGTLEPAELGRPPIENPNRAAASATASSSSSRPTSPGRGWSRGSEHPPDARGWSKASDHPASGRGWSQGGDNPTDGRGWSDRSATDRGYSSGNDYSSRSDRGWTRGGENPTDGRGWTSQRPPNP